MTSGNHRTKLRRMPARGSYDRKLIDEILKDSFVAHVGFVVDTQPFVIPTLYAPHADGVYLHGSAVSRMLRTLDTGTPCCVTVTIVDGLVFARSAFNHSMNYRSVVAFGTARALAEESEKVSALKRISEHVVHGRWAEVRLPNSKELKATTVINFTIEEASAKVRSGPPIDDDEDYTMAVWAGVVPLVLERGTPVPDPLLPREIAVPTSVDGFCSARVRHDHVG